MNVSVINADNAAKLPNNALALMGDAVHTAFVSKRLIESHDFKANELYRRETVSVSAKAQSRLLDEIMPSLTEEETEIVRRGHSARTNNKPKNALWSEYRKATAYETLLGFLYLSGQTERLEEILEMSNKKEERL